MRGHASTRSAARGGTDRGFSLIELVTALAISSILIIAMGSAVMVVARAAPSTQSEDLAEAEARMDWLILEVSEAEQVKAAGNGVLTFVVPDRNFDGQTELISYSWDRNAGSPLYRSFNGKPAEIALSAIDSFSAATEQRSYTLGLPQDIVRERLHTATVSVTPHGSGRAITRTIGLPNAPQVLKLWARAEFDDNTDPVNIDRDWSGTTDWYAGSGHSAGSIDDGWWTADSTLSVRAPGVINDPLTISARLSIGNEGEYAQFYTMLSPAALSAAALRLTIERRSSDIRLTVEQMTSALWIKLFDEDVSIAPLDVTLAVVPKAQRVYLRVNGELLEGAAYTKSAFGTSGAVQFDRRGSSIRVDWIDVQIGGKTP